MVKAVFDTVVFVRSLINPFGRWGELIFTYSNKYQLFVSQPVVEEYLDVLHRKELIKKFQTLVNLDLGKIIELISQAQNVEISSIPDLSRDPKDNKFIATAASCKADYLVTEDRDLLDLEEYKGTRIVTALQFLHILDGTLND